MPGSLWRKQRVHGRVIAGCCEDNGATATCIASLDTTTGFANYIVPTNTVGTSTQPLTLVVLP
jgi:hypothetical protein